MTYMMHWVYDRIGAHVGDPDDRVAELREWADGHVVGGRAAITDEMVAAILGEHADAKDLYRDVMRGR